MEEFIRNKLITLYSSRIVDEFKTFIWNNNKAEAMRSYHDDLVMALAIGCWVRDTALTVNERDMQYRKAMIASIQSSKKTLNTTISGMMGYRQGPYSDEMLEQKKNYEQFVWLIKG